jgi:hypothetical protein
MAISDIGTLLFHSTTGASASFTKLFDVTAVPATGSMPTKIDATTLTDEEKSYLAGRVDRPDQEFSFLYTEANMALAIGTEGSDHWFLVIYADGSGALIKGQSRAWIDAVGQDQAVVGKLGVVPQAITYPTATQVTALKSA